LEISILKFGGTSVGDSFAIKQAASRVIECKSDIKIVVLSAMSKVTDELIKIANLSTININQSILELNNLRNRHIATIEDIIPNNNQEIKSKLNQYFFELENLSKGINFLEEFTSKILDKFISYGELLSTEIFNAYLVNLGYSSELNLSTNYIITDSTFNQAIPIFEEINKRFLNFKFDCPIIIFQGFIGSNLNGETTTLGRGGSDFTASIIGSALKNNQYNVKEIIIYTDVDGILNCDPRTNINFRLIPEISYQEVLELSFFGAKVLHPDTIKPAIDKGIPVIVRNTFKPEVKGTMINNNSNNRDTIVVDLLDVLFIKLYSRNSVFAKEELKNIFNLVQNLSSKIYYQSFSLNKFQILIKNDNSNFFDYLDDNIYIKIYKCTAKAYIKNNIYPDNNNIILSGYSPNSYIEIISLEETNMFN